MIGGVLRRARGAAAVASSTVRAAGRDLHARRRARRLRAARSYAASASTACPWSCVFHHVAPPRPRCDQRLDQRADQRVCGLDQEQRLEQPGHRPHARVEVERAAGVRASAAWPCDPRCGPRPARARAARARRRASPRRGEHLREPEPVLPAQLRRAMRSSSFSAGGRGRPGGSGSRPPATRSLSAARRRVVARARPAPARLGPRRLAEVAAKRGAAPSRPPRCRRPRLEQHPRRRTRESHGVVQSVGAPDPMPPSGRCRRLSVATTRSSSRRMRASAATSESPRGSDPAR